MTIEEIIAERDSILNNLYDGLIEPSEGLTVAQTHRQRALEAFLSQDIHHTDLAEAMNKFFSEAIDKLSHNELSDKLIQYTEDAYFLNQKAGREILPISLRLERLFEAGSLDMLFKNQTPTLRTVWNSLIKDINTQDLYMGIRHVMPESLEMRQLINNTDSYIAMLEAYAKPSMKIDNYAQLEWDRVPPPPENITWTNQYKPPQTLEELKAMFGRFKEEFPNKAREFILGQNILLEENPEPRLWNDEYYQFTGWGTGTTNMPVSQMNTHLEEFYDKLLGLERNEMMNKKAMELGFDDATDWFNQLLEEEKAKVPGNEAGFEKFDLARQHTFEDAEQIVKQKLGSFYEVSPFDSLYQNEIEFVLRPVDKNSVLGDAAYKVINKPLDTPTNVPDNISELADTPTNVVDDIPPNQTLRVMEESGLSSHSERIRKVAQDYHKIMGYSDPEFKPAMVFNDEIGAVAADIFEQLPMYDDAAIPYYNKFIKETNMQYQTLLDSGMQFELTDTDPYTPNRAGHTQMINDMENGVLKVLSTEAGFGNEATNAANPMLKNSIYTDINGKVMLENDVFRAVHDTFGHGMRGNTFGPVGEYNAWLAHKEMYSSDARRVMTTETLGQNTYTNYGQHMRDANGNLLSKGDPNYLKPADRPYAPQKVAVMPQDIIETAGKVVDDASELVDVNRLNKVIEIANTNPGVADNLFKSAKNIVGKVFGTAGAIADPGDIAITQGITRILPRLGLAAIAAPALSAYIGYELIVLLADAANAFNVATQNQDVNLLEYNPDVDWKKVGKDTWQEFGEVSDTWSLSWKISEPIIDYAFNEYAKLQENR